MLHFSAISALIEEELKSLEAPEGGERGTLFSGQVTSTG